MNSNDRGRNWSYGRSLCRSSCSRPVEIGIGSGLNLPFYSPDLQRVRGVDPSSELQRMARKRTPDCGMPVEFLSQSAEDSLALPDESIDTVVVTWTLCSIPNAPKALRQMNRLK